MIEAGVLFFALALARDAVRRGGPWLATLLAGMASGLVGETLVLASADGSIPCYTYDTAHFLHVGGVPVWVGVGWGIILYAAMSTGGAWSASPLRSALVAGLLAVNLDLSLEPAAQASGYWTWTWPATFSAARASYFGIPYDNFTGWFGFVSLFTLCSQLATRFGSRVPAVSARGRVASHLVLPLGAASGAVGSMAALRSPVLAVYGALGAHATGHVVVFVGLLVAAAAALIVDRGARPVAPRPSRAILALVVYVHALSAGLLLARHASPRLLAVVLANAIVGVALFAAPFVRARLRRDAPPESADGVLARLTSYGGSVSVARVFTPGSLEDLRRVLLAARACGARITFRAGGTSFDSQALGDGWVVSLERLRAIAVDEAGATLTAGAGARWRDILEHAARRGFVPPILVTTPDATAGGTLSSHSISRFTPTLGREGRHVRRFTLMLPDGRELECSRTTNADLFGAVVGGLGTVGAVVEVTYDLMKAPAPLARLAVETEFVKLTGFEPLVRRLLDLAASGAVAPDAQTARAVSAVVYLRGTCPSLVAVSRYREAPPGPWSRCSFHMPDSIGHGLLQLIAQIGPLRDWGYRIVFERSFRRPQVFVDDLFGYTFFQDGNQRVRRLGRRLGLAMGIRQQTYMIPCHVGDVARSTRRLAEFLDLARGLVESSALLPALVDLLFVPADEEFLLSSSRELPSFAVTFTFERLTSCRLPKEEQICRTLSTACERAGGRVHLVKQVYAEPEQIAGMYAGALDEMRRVRERAGATGVVVSEFTRRVLPGLEGA